MSDIENGNQIGFEWYASGAQEEYKLSRSFVGDKEELVRLHSGVSAEYGEKAFYLAQPSLEERTLVVILGRDVVNAYYNAGRFKDVLRFSDVYLKYLKDIFPGDVPRTTQSIIKGIEIIKTVSLDKISPQSPNPQPLP